MKNLGLYPDPIRGFLRSLIGGHELLWLPYDENRADTIAVPALFDLVRAEKQTEWRQGSQALSHR